MLQIYGTNMVRPFNLSNTEIDILSCLSNGRNYVGAMEVLGLSENEVTLCVASIFKKMSCKSVENLLYHIKQSELETDLALRYMEIFDTFLQKSFPKPIRNTLFLNSS